MKEAIDRDPAFLDYLLGKYETPLIDRLGQLTLGDIEAAQDKLRRESLNVPLAIPSWQLPYFAAAWLKVEE